MLRKKLKSFLAKDNEASRTNRLEPALRLVEVREGIKPSIIIINGFLSKNGEDIQDWLEIVNELYPTNQVLHAKWDAGDLTGLMMDKGLFAGGSTLFTQVIGGSPLAKVLSVASITVNKVTGHWKKAFQETKEVGLELAITLEENKTLHGSILMGHSLGVRVIRHTLADLEKPVVDTAYLLAGAVSSQQSQWSDIFSNHPETKFINCMSQNDSVLKNAYQIGCLFDHKPVGLTPLCEESCTHLINIDVSDYANGHSDFKNKKLAQYLKKELMGFDRTKVAEIGLELC